MKPTNQFRSKHGDLRLLNLLRDISARLCDAREGYLQAAEQASNERLRTLFRLNSTVRDVFEGEIAKLRVALGDSGSEGMTATGAFRAYWNSFRELLGSNEDGRILTECERWEKMALAEYDSVLEDGATPPAVAEVLIRQKREIEGEIEDIRELGKQLAA